MTSNIFKQAILLCLSIHTCFLFAQSPQAVPLSFDATLYKKYQEKAQKNHKTAATASTTDTITLPFIDDFSLTNTFSADTSKWLDEGGGAYVNNRFPVFPPTKNVVTFDALMEDGTPYDFSDNEGVTVGLADFLTSKPIDLSGIVASDSLAFSFYWQKGGREINSFPDQNDSLRVQFLDASEEWVTQRVIYGDTVVTENSLKSFYYEFFHVTDSRYFHEGFKMRFQVFCNLRGNFDIYHVDYIYLDTARKVSSVTADVAYSTPLTSYLSPYTSTTKKQFFADPAQFIADSVISYVVDPSGSNFTNANINKEPGYLKDTISNTTLEIMPTGINALLSPGDQQKAFWLPSPDSITDNIPPLDVASPIVFKYKFDMVTQDSLLANDSIIGYNIVDNYMAYDDGSAEGAYKFPKNGNQYALKFELLEQDTLYFIQAYFPKLITSIENNSIQWRVWTALEGVDGATEDNLIYAKTAILQYSDELNGFSIDSLTEKEDFPFSGEDGVVIPPGTFYVGLVQFTSDEIPIGYDVNTNAGSNFYVNSGSVWQNNFGSSNHVSLMIRPVFGTRKPFDLTPVTPVKKELKFTVYPNPSESEIKINRPLDLVNIYDLTGNLMLSFEKIDASNELDISSLPTGMYLLEGTFDKYKSVKKIIKH